MVFQKNKLDDFGDGKKFKSMLKIITCPMTEVTSDRFFSLLDFVNYFVAAIL